MPHPGARVARALTLLLVAFGAPALVLRQRLGGGWIVDDVVVAVLLAGWAAVAVHARLAVVTPRLRSGSPAA
ncbi:hypothetical protein [Isoptericola sp. NPDC057559]|uniref:hypothetical protein n=1 Tax=Isoptericola sp. NPDC057559 TaxID=3346168 RepID=UPI00368F15E6